MTRYNYDFSNLKKGKQFKDFTALFESITGQKPSTGARNRAAYERELSRHIKYCKASKINPEITSKRAIIIQEIYDTPLQLDEKRGKHGKYSDYLKPLLLISCGFCSFSGKMYQLANVLGIFSKYLLDQFNKMEVLKYGKQIDRREYNPWKISEVMMPGREQYIRTLWNQIRTTIERSLNALQKEKIIEWQYYHQLMPDILIDIEDSEGKRTKSKAELEKDQIRREKLLEEIQSDGNAVLLPETIEQLNIYSEKWGHPIKHSAFTEGIIVNGNALPLEFTIRATPEQEKAIKNLEQFMRQYTYKKHNHLDRFPKIEDVPNEYNFFQDRRLYKDYKQLIKEMYPWLIECKTIWKELEYEIIGDCSQLENYIDIQNFDGENCAQSLSLAYLNYMDSHMEKIMFRPTEETLSDLKEKRVYRPDKPILEEPISMSKSAYGLHRELQQFYKI